MQKHIRIIEHPQIGELTLIADYKYKGIRYCVSTHKNKILFNPLYSDRVLPLSDDTINWFINSKQKIKLKVIKQNISKNDFYSMGITHKIILVFAIFYYL